jgi:hypothetical protein
MKRIVLGALGVLLAALVFAPTSSAARLPLAAPRLTVFTTRVSSACTTAAISVTSAVGNGNNNSVVTYSVSMAVPAACAGLTYKITILGSGGTVLATAPIQGAALPLTSGTGATIVDFSPQSFNSNKVTGIALVINGRSVVATWGG